MMETIALKIAGGLRQKSKYIIEGPDGGGQMSNANYPDFETSCGYGHVQGIGGA